MCVANSPSISNVSHFFCRSILIRMTLREY
nr:MAG TPA: hypothetical protein [Inoviridae sp.]